MTTATDTSVRMFRNDVVERLTHVRPWVPHLLYVPLVAFCLWRSPLSPIRTTLLFAGGALLWSFVEYVMHRFVFHAPDAIMDGTHEIAAGLPRGEPVIPHLPTWRHVAYFIAHGVHHEFPSDSTRLVMPPGASIPLAVLFYALFRVCVGDATLGLFAGFVTGYLAYDTIHFAVHHQGLPTRWGRFLKKRHARHHFVDADEDYGVSSPLWDVVFGTFGARKAG